MLQARKRTYSKRESAHKKKAQIKNPRLLTAGFGHCGRYKEQAKAQSIKGEITEIKTHNFEISLPTLNMTRDPRSSSLNFYNLVGEL